MLRKFWLLFAQACTLCLAALFVVATLRPDLLPRLAFRGGGPVVLLQEPAAHPSAEAHAAGKAGSFAEAARRAMPAVVNVYTSNRPGPHPLVDDAMFRRMFPDLAGRTVVPRPRSLGSGVIVAAEGYVLTNYHVVEGADEIQLGLIDGRRLPARLVGSDPESDLAVLKTDTGGLPAITLGSLEGVQVGDAVLAIGNPYGFGSTVTSGIVSALGRNRLGVNRFEDFIQTDAAINPGNSGGALVDASGALVGINSEIYSQTGGSQGIGFAIPVSLARNVLQQIIETGEVTRGWLGVQPQDVNSDLARALALGRDDGVLISGLERGGPADRAGMQVRDVVVEIAGRPTRDTPALLARIAELAPGSTAEVRVLREGKPVVLAVVVGKRPKAR